MGFSVERNTKETQIKAELDFASTERAKVSVDTSLPFFDHILGSMAFHGRMDLEIHARGDVQVDPHHLVEDVGLVLGSCLAAYCAERGPTQRFGRATIPMDDALSEVVVDLGGRPYLVYRADFPQTHAGAFDVSLIREFLHGMVVTGSFNLHSSCRYGENAHHMIESLFKAFGRALHEACVPVKGEIRSTKGVI